MARYVSLVGVFAALAAMCMAFNAVAEELDLAKEFEAAPTKMKSDLSSPFAKVGLETLVWRFYEERIKWPVAEYENSDEFKRSFRASFAEFTKLLRDPEILHRLEPMSSAETDAMIRAYEMNRKQFNMFTELSRREGMLRSPEITVELLLRSQIYFSLILYNGARAAWKYTFETTGFYPFCSRK